MTHIVAYTSINNNRENFVLSEVATYFFDKITTKDTNNSDKQCKLKFQLTSFVLIQFFDIITIFNF